MRRFVDQTIAAICDEASRAEGGSEDRGEILRSFVTRQLANAPGFLRLPLLAATAFFGLCGWRSGAAFHRLTPDRRRRQLQRWRASRLGPFRDLMRFYDSLCLLAYYGR